MTAHEKLLSMGYEEQRNELWRGTYYRVYVKKGGSITFKHRGNISWYVTKIDVEYELAKILTQYMKEMVLNELDELTELDELKNWQEELIKTIEDLISKGKHWKEKENKTEFEKGIARGYTTMLHQLLIGIDFDEEVKE